MAKLKTFIEQSGQVMDIVMMLNVALGTIFIAVTYESSVIYIGFLAVFVSQFIIILTESIRLHIEISFMKLSLVEQNRQ
ncbi:hypothetical protein ACPV5Q_18125 [Vibrio astriarenae]|jgi:uncharacterized membrane protein YhhN